MRTCVAVSGRAKSSVTSLNFGAPGAKSSVRRKARLVVGIVVVMVSLDNCPALMVNERIFALSAVCLQHRYKSNLNDKQALEIKNNISLATDARSCKIVEAIDLQLCWAVM
jgi:hypothetical protein